jgi:hypothetical protein
MLPLAVLQETRNWDSIDRLLCLLGLRLLCMLLLQRVHSC